MEARAGRAPCPKTRAVAYHPPVSSYVTIMSVLFHAGLARTASLCSSRRPRRSIHPRTAPFVALRRTTHCDESPSRSGYTFAQSSERPPTLTNSSSLRPLTGAPSAASTTSNVRSVRYVRGSTW